MTLNLKYLSNSKKGLNRDRNQDRILIIENEIYCLFAIFDGVSSRPCSYKFINEFKRLFKTRIQQIKISETNLPQLLYDIHYDTLNLKFDGMSTMSVLFFNKLNKNVNFINIGDSRIYKFTNQFLEKITNDDSLPGRRNVITKCLGLESLALDDFKMHRINFNSNFLICSDGFYELLENNLKEYFETFNFKNYRNIEKKLAILQRRKNKDDSSYIIIKNEISN
jgi:serine/threonine protein phosphatase PrpC